MELNDLPHGGFAVHASDNQRPHIGEAGCPGDVTVALGVDQGEGVAPQVVQRHVPDVHRLAAQSFGPRVDGRHHLAGFVGDGPTCLLRCGVREDAHLKVVHGLLTQLNLAQHLVVFRVVVVGDDVKLEQFQIVDVHRGQGGVGQFIRVQIAFPIVRADDLGLVEGQHARHLNGARRQRFEALVQQAHRDLGWDASTSERVSAVAHQHGVVGQGGGCARCRLQQRRVASDRGLPRLGQKSTWTHGVNRGIVRALERVEDVLRVVNDGIMRSGDPVARRGRPCALQVRLGRAVVSFDEEHAQLVGAVGAVGVVQLFQHAAFVVRPTRTAPRGGEVQNDLVPAVQIAVEVVLHAIEVGGGEIGGHTSVWKLGAGQSCAQQEEKGRKLFHR